ncbi:murein biosynthesis integral membrane protein MurJ [Pseudoclavibacter sp. RFBG4]|uniref:murein biosynthesis integral membrane protein MurJ n=1 Tax=Pseudoclavibacter sp. RFBG4 TaxID=2080575 RepID=UPI000CE7AFF9|nr:murein biosynthesis integral membrane protein MurJ [Pseudoclavibacter sp. RFBG4]PPG36587.1 murein biosynthesis integral membrane protein MurJ [Pseudoclavibacter sp. RFBG4]
MAQGIARASALLASGTMVSRVLGFVKAIVIAQTIGVIGVSADAYAGANQLPSNIYSIISVGLLNAVIVPQVVKAARHEDGGQLYVNRLVTLAMVLLGGLTILATVGAPIIGALYGASLSPEQLGLLVAFAYWCMPQIFFYGMYAVLGEILNARGLFGPFAWAPVINNIVGIAGLLLFSTVFGADPTGQDRVISDWDPTMIAVLGGTATVGVAMQTIVLLFFWRRAGLRFGLDFQFRGTGLGQVGRLAGWTLGMLLVMQLAGLVETIVANVAFGRAASIAAMQNAFLIFALPHAVIAVSIATAFFTRMSAAISDGKPKDFIRDLSEGSRLIGMFLVFSGFGLALVSVPFARIFASTDTGINSIALTLVAFLVGLIPFSGLFLVQRAFYALEDTKTIFFVFLFTLPLHIFGMALAAIGPVELIVVGLALMQSIMSTLRLAILLFILRNRMGQLDFANIARSYVRFTIAAIAASIPALIVMMLLGTFQEGGFPRSGIFQALVSCAIGAGIMALFYFPLLWLLKSPEFRGFAGPLLARFGIKPGPPSSPARPGEQDLDGDDLPVFPETVTVGAEDSAPTPWNLASEEIEPDAADERRQAAEQEQREERVNAASWAFGGATEDLSTAGIILPMHSRTTEIPKVGRQEPPRTRRERREEERRAVIELAARREEEARLAREARSQADDDDGRGSTPRPKE